MLPALLSLNNAEVDPSVGLRKRLADLAYTLPIEKIEECLELLEKNVAEPLVVGQA
jgi:hypothetical protein